MVLEQLLQLAVLFFVIFDPPASLAVFLSATEKMKQKEKNQVAFLAVLVAAALSYGVLFLGQQILFLFNTTIADFRVAGGIVLLVLGVKMTTGLSLVGKNHKNSGRAIASIIATPLLTGPAAITAIIASSYDYGILLTGGAITIVLIIAGVIFSVVSRYSRFVGGTGIQVMSTIFGLITLSWAIRFIRIGLGI